MNSLCQWWILLIIAICQLRVCYTIGSAAGINQRRFSSYMGPSPADTCIAERLKAFLHTTPEPDIICTIDYPICDRQLQLEFLSFSDRQWIEVLHNASNTNWTSLQLTATNLELSPIFYHIFTKRFLSQIPRLESIHVQQQEIDGLSMRLMVQALRKQSQLTKLTFAHCNIHHSGMKYLVILLNVRKTIKYMDLRGNQLDEEGMQTLVTAWTAGNGQALEHLDLSYNPKLGKHLHLLSSAIKSGYLPKLNTLILREVGASSQDIALLLESLAASTVEMQVLDISGNMCLASKPFTSKKHKVPLLASGLLHIRKVFSAATTHSGRPTVVGTLQTSQAVVLASTSQRKLRKYKTKSIREVPFRQVRVTMTPKNDLSKTRGKSASPPSPSYKIAQALLRFVHNQKSSMQSLQLNQVYFDDEMTTLITKIAEKEFPCSNQATEESLPRHFKISLQLNPALSAEKIQTIETIFTNI